jgi:HSP20 family protein
MAKKRSFFERLTGAVDTEQDNFEVETNTKEPESGMDWENRPEEAQLNVDVINAPDEIIIKALVAGVKPEELDIAITREMVTIEGQRIDKDMFAKEDYVHGELFWGSFSRTILLPEEVEVEEARAVESHGLLTISLPKIDKKRQTKLQVQTQH